MKLERLSGATFKYIKQTAKGGKTVSTYGGNKMIIVKWQEVINGKKKDIHQHVVNMQLANQLRNSKRSEGINAWIEMEEK
jgi:hypothetical protein